MVFNRPVALAGSRRAGQVLRDGTQGEAAAQAALPWVECSRQLCDTGEEETPSRPADAAEQRSHRCDK